MSQARLAAADVLGPGKRADRMPTLVSSPPTPGGPAQTIAAGARQPEANARAVDAAVVHAPTSPIVEIKRTCARIAPSDATVLLTGRDRHRQGAGRAAGARGQHAHRSRVRRGQLRRHPRGAARERAVRPRARRLHRRRQRRGAGGSTLADGGTLFLDEIGELPLALQVKLLRAAAGAQLRAGRQLASRSRRRPAGRRHQPRSRARGRAAGRFREDLYYRLNVCPDAPAAAARAPRGRRAAVRATSGAQRGEAAAASAPDGARAPRGLRWPGNVRELENVVERALGVHRRGRRRSGSRICRAAGCARDSRWSRLSAIERDHRGASMSSAPTRLAAEPDRHHAGRNPASGAPPAHPAAGATTRGAMSRLATQAAAAPLPFDGTEGRGKEVADTRSRDRRGSGISRSADNEVTATPSVPAPGERKTLPVDLPCCCASWRPPT